MLNRDHFRERNAFMPGEPLSDENAYILGAESSAEMARLMKQDRLITVGMGGLLPERVEVSALHDVLDIACGPGGWALDLAYTYAATRVVGIDISRTMVQYAQTRAQVQELKNASFIIMNALGPLDFADASFDLVNARFLVGFMPQAAWPKFLQECRRITRPGGIIRLTEFDEPGTTNSAAFEQWMTMVFRAVQKAGFTSAPDGRNYGIMPRLGRLLRDAGCQHIGQRAHVIDFSAGTEAHEIMFDNCKVAFQLVKPFLFKLGVATKAEVEESYQQMLLEMMSPEFCAVWSYLTAWGQVPPLEF